MTTYKINSLSTAVVVELVLKYYINGPNVVFVSFCNHASQASIICLPVNIPIIKVLIIVLYALRTHDLF